MRNQGQLVAVILAIVLASTGCADQHVDVDGSPEGETLLGAILVLDTECANAGTVTWEQEEWALAGVAPSDWWRAGPIEGQIVVASNGYEGTFTADDGYIVPVIGRTENLDFTVEETLDCVTYD